MERRDFIKVAVAAGLGSNTALAVAQQSQKPAGNENAAGFILPRIKDPGEFRGEMLYRLLGRTRERVSAIGLGGLRFDDPDRIFAKGGAMEAFVAAKRAGKIRYIGFTGHKDPRIHLYTLETAAKHEFRFDTVQVPLNVMDAHFRSFAQLVVPRLTELEIGVLGMKAFGGADGVILKSKTVEPLECLHYSLNLPTSVVITGIDKQEVLDQAFEAVKTFRPMSEEEVEAHDKESNSNRALSFDRNELIDGY